MTTFASLFTCGGGVDIGARAAGLELAWGVEVDPAIAEVANANLDNHVRVADILTQNPNDYTQVDVLHASPPCPSFSVATRRGESSLDIELANKVCDFLRVLKPRIFTLENVEGYRHSSSWLLIQNTLHKLGYWVHAEKLNAADFGVPQSRKRMIVRAVLGGFLPALPQPQKHMGWYEAIEDLIPELPETEFAEWQLEHLKLNQGTFIADGQPNSNASSVTQRHASQPMYTVMASVDRKMPRAWLFTENSDITIRKDNETSPTVTASRNQAGIKAMLEQGRVVRMTTRALARFQSFPDWYELPEGKTLACKVIGNAVPPLMYQGVLEGLIHA